MSADVWLEVDGASLEEIECPWCGMESRTGVPVRVSARADLHSWNLTYNLSPMLAEAGMPRWADQLGQRAADLSTDIAKVAHTLHADPARFRAMNPANGWGDYEGALVVMQTYAAALITHPDATVGGWL